MIKQMQSMAKDAIVTTLGQTHRQYSQALLPHNQRYLLLLSHMRARTSLLSHILGSSPEIGGYVEQHLSYGDVQDLRHLHCRYMLQNTSVRPRRYLFDKMLNVRLAVDDTVIRHPDTYFLFMLREPQPTLPSIIANMPHLSIERAVAYYLRRLEQLRHLAERMVDLRKPFLYLDTDILVKDSARAFSSLEHFLELRNHLSEQYKVRRLTGKAGGYGDKSENIKAGAILRKTGTARLEITVPQDYADQCTERYQETRALLIEASSCPVLATA